MPDRKPNSERKIVDGCNALARTFYRMQGCVVPEGYRFDRAHHPAERLCWAMAVEAYDHLMQTDVTNALAELDE